VGRRFPNQGKRRWIRYSANAPVKVVSEAPNDPPVVDGRCIKISDGGLCLFAVANFATGTQISVDFVDPSLSLGKPARVRGIIRNRAVYLYGVECEPQAVAIPRLRE